MHPDHARYDDLLHGIYDAAIEPARWPTALAGIADACGGKRSVLFTPAHGPAQGGFVFSHNLSQANIELWSAKSRLEDPLMQAALRQGLVREGNAVDGAALLPHETLAATPFYRELWAPMDIGRVCSGVIFDGTDAHKVPAVVSVYSRLQDPPFDAADLDLMRRLVAHMSRALGVMFHLRDSQLQVASTLAGLDRLPACVVLLAGDGRVDFVNTAATRLLNRATALALNARGASRIERLSLVPSLAHHEPKFQRAIAEALSPSTKGVTAHFSNALVVPDAVGKPACVIHVAPLGQGMAGNRGGSSARRGAILFAYDLATASSLAPGLLCELFHLTPAEARAALQILQGGTVDAMATRLGVRLSTFKTQLQAAYAKTNTNRQTDLLKLLLALSSA